MGFKNLRITILIRVIFLIGSIFLLSYLFFQEENQVNTIFVGVIIAIQLYFLIRTLDKTNREIASFLSSIKYDDFTTT
ncbi:MAG TPA: ATP-binding protein, partial [Roseivirga sp.]